ncbi:site-specific integrase [Jatrophihabitans endophyticus]|uniref:tyrosine-type recombinase/integrase n=1 Tax=Jatrophihabitans endophyticus TaxID=1206085 RepID=UPI0019E696C1|nr:site-specific integrase [Jatrophihabitans endophyticus]MBE7188189.1 site-specific integrase [Jatrophihabitans endophyticus]
MAFAQLRTTSAGTPRWYAIYFTVDGRQRSGGGFSTRRDAERAAVKLEERAAAGTLADAARGKLTFADYVEKFYWPAAQHLEPTTLGAYRSNLDSHFLPRFGRHRMTKIVASTVQAWVNDVSADVEDFDGNSKPRLSPRSVRKYHMFLHAIFERAIIDQVIVINPCAHTVLPKFVGQPKKAITPEQFETLLAEIPQRYRILVLVAIETGVRWGELAALRPVDVDLEAGEIEIRRVVLEVSKKITGAEKVWTIRDYPKDNEHRAIRIGDQLCRDIREFLVATGKRGEDLLFSSSTGSPISRNVFRTRVWLPAIERADLRQRVRFHDLRGAHASWLLAGGADLKAVMDRLGHKQIQTTQQYLGRLPDADDRALAAFESVRMRRH